MMRKMMNVWIVALCLVLASSILVKGECEKTNILGTIEAIGDSEITVDGTTVDAADAVIYVMEVVDGVKQKVEKDFNYLAEGMTVKVCGTMVVDVLVADKINVRYGGAIE